MSPLVEEGFAGRYVGRPVRRREDARFITGRGRYTDDIVFPRQLHAAFVRSPIARGTIKGIDVSAALEVEGVEAVYTAEDLSPLAHEYWSTLAGPLAPGPRDRALADGEVLYVGEPIAIVVATSRYIAEDGADLVTLDLEAKQAIVTIDEALNSGRYVHEEFGTNIASEMPAAPNPDLDEVFATAPHVFSETFFQHRYTCVPMECRAINVWWDPWREQLEVIVSTQAPHEVRASLVRLLALSEEKVHVVMPDVGGSFGQKSLIAREERVVALAAVKLGRAIKWIEDRAENLIGGGHAREDALIAEMACDDDGHILAIKGHYIQNNGAFPRRGTMMIAGVAAHVYPGGYKIPLMAFSGQALYSNTGGRCAYRGPWMMETVGRELLVDIVADRMGIDPIEFRRRNVLQQSDLPYVNAAGVTLETVSPAETLEQAAEMAGYEAFREEQAKARAEGRHLGIGFALYIEPQHGSGILGTEGATLRVDPTGRIALFISAAGHGQGNETTAVQLVAEELSVDIDLISYTQGDTASVPYSAGSGGSRSAAIVSGAAIAIGRKMRERLVEVGAQLLEASPDDVEFTDGVLSVKGDPSTAMTLAQLAAAAYHTTDLLPEGAESGLQVTTRYKSPHLMFSNATHAAIVETDVVTGFVKILRYIVSEDCGNMVNPMIVEGQVAGGVAQGIGGVFYEHFEYDEVGNPLTTTFLDYHLPTAAEVPDYENGHIVTPSNTPGGFKGMGEAGAIVSVPALINAVRDSLKPYGVDFLSQPLTPEAVVNAIAKGQAAQRESASATA